MGMLEEKKHNGLKVDLKTKLVIKGSKEKEYPTSECQNKRMME